MPSWPPLRIVRLAWRGEQSSSLVALVFRPDKSHEFPIPSAGPLSIPLVLWMQKLLQTWTAVSFVEQLAGGDSLRMGLLSQFSAKTSTRCGSGLQLVLHLHSFLLHFCYTWICSCAQQPFKPFASSVWKIVQSRKTRGKEFCERGYSCSFATAFHFTLFCLPPHNSISAKDKRSSCFLKWGMSVLPLIQPRSSGD